MQWVRNMISINTNNSINNKVNINTNNNVKITNPSFKAQQPNQTERMSKEAAEALKAQRIGQPTIPHITEKDINFEVTCVGYGNIRGNTRDVRDFRCAMSEKFGYYWYNNFYKPHLLRNCNGDERKNGETTAIVIPLHPLSEGIRGQDNMTILLNGNVPTAITAELIDFMEEVGILNKSPIGRFQYYVNSKQPKEFMSNPKVKSAIAYFFKQKEAELAQAQKHAQEQSQDSRAEEPQKTKTNTPPKSKINSTHINLANIGGKQNINNARTVENYVRYFLENNREFTVVHDQYTNNGKETDVTAILLPSKKSPMDCITITIDKKLDRETCKNLINHLVKQKITNVDNPVFRKAIVEYLNTDSI